MTTEPHQPQRSPASRVRAFAASFEATRRHGYNAYLHAVARDEAGSFTIRKPLAVYALLAAYTAPPCIALAFVTLSPSIDSSLLAAAFVLCAWSTTLLIANRVMRRFEARTPPAGGAPKIGPAPLELGTPKSLGQRKANNGNKPSYCPIGSPAEAVVAEEAGALAGAGTQTQAEATDLALLFVTGRDRPSRPHARTAHQPQQADGRLGNSTYSLRTTTESEETSA